jgi:hypothetical protein
VDAINEVWVDAKAAVDATSLIDQMKGAVLEHFATRLVLARWDPAMLVLADGAPITGSSVNGHGQYAIPVDTASITATLNGRLVYAWTRWPQQSVDYNAWVHNKPEINGVILQGPLTGAMLGLVSSNDIADFYTMPANGIPASDFDTATQNRLLPTGGVDGQLLRIEGGVPGWSTVGSLELVATRDSNSITFAGDGATQLSGLQATLRLDTQQENFITVSALGVRSHIDGAVRYDQAQNLQPSQVLQVLETLNVGDYTTNFITAYNAGKASV